MCAEFHSHFEESLLVYTSLERKGEKERRIRMEFPFHKNNKIIYICFVVPKALVFRFHTIEPRALVSKVSKEKDVRAEHVKHT